SGTVRAGTSPDQAGDAHARAPKVTRAGQPSTVRLFSSRRRPLGVASHRKSCPVQVHAWGPVGCGCVPDPDAPLDTGPPSGPTGQADDGGTWEARIDRWPETRCLGDGYVTAH